MGELLHKFPEETSIFGHICRKPANFTPDLGNKAGTWAAITRESLTIAGWVAMWRPMQIYLYDWWPLRRRGRVYRKLSRMAVEVTQKEKS